ncbi:HAD family hydrolase [Halanaeroarchaeum sulfurireducens]|uniref:Haloacid dehalogenase superfamily enzyme, subfamily IA n=1 Tax=Halanaeroarchaeum sulfurireducens TaxID=1604004 RepID=A0A0F7PA95_9EURY|nr:HAD family hydrolase [Halanaeroarchaeum sulfurireducens]AKH97120.1 haloacid dehalogenase superfamily enzyme, subfamily IA [Halanaeroarchaeum sulfurireducens]ALG81521.1 haloacid dehalogenase superfamily enzyme, subfamily IA [Halanaeroarchaeum sulfurireducens]
MPETDAVLFDLDDTLCLHEQDREVLLRRTFDHIGVEPFTNHAGLRTAINRAPDADGATAFMANAFDVAAERADAGRMPTARIADTYMSMFDSSAVRFREGARAALDRVEDRPVGLVTNGDREHQLPKLESLGIEDAFDTIVYGGANTPSKPSPEPFEIALDDLGADPGATIHVGNSLSDDVAGANRVGVRSVWVPTAADRREAGSAEPTHTLDSLRNLPALF